MMLNLATNKWQLKSTNDNSALVNDLKKAGLDYSSAFLNVCISRGLTSPSLIEEFINEENLVFHNPFLMHDMDKAIDRIEEAVELGEKIVIYGDYDADGITATLILLEGLEMVGANVDFYLPNRHIDGYGPNLSRYEKLIDEGAQLIITCDNGVTGYEAVDYANSQGVDVIISDHHTIQETLPDAYAIVHPNHPDASYPFGDLAGAGVALKIITALLQEVPQELLELAAIGTVCDLVSLTDENRTIVKTGLKLMQNTQRVGLKLLLESQSVDLCDVDEDTIGFIIGPRLNSVGRLADPTPGLELLRTYDVSEAQEKLKIINETNDKRRELVDSITKDISQRLQVMDSLPNIIIEASPDWSAGVLGIVASRVADKYQRPCILFEYMAEEDLYKGSGRSIESVNLFEWLNSNKDTMTQFGGHSQAAGMSVAGDKWETFKTQLTQTANLNEDQVLKPATLDIDLLVEPGDVTVELIEELKLLAPFGTDNPPVVVMVEDAEVSYIKNVGRDQSHIKLTVSSQGKQLDAIAFSQADEFKGINQASKISLVGKLDINEWNGKQNPQICVEDRGIKGPLWLDCRGSRIPEPLLKLKNTLYLFENRSISNQYEAVVDPSSKINLYRSQMIDFSSFDYLVIMEPATKIDQLTPYLKHSWKRIYLGAYTHESYYMAGPVKRDECGRVYTYIKQVKSFKIIDHLPIMIEKLNLPLIKINCIIMMFFEAGFIEIDEGVISLVAADSSRKVDLKDLDSYKAYLEALENEKLLTMTPVNKLTEYFEG